MTLGFCMSDDFSSRRRALQVLAGVGVAGVAAVGALPTVRLALAPLSQSGGEGGWSPVVKLDDLPDGQPVRLRIFGDQHDGFAAETHQPLGLVWFLRTKDAVTAFSATCPHLGCTVDLGTDAQSFFCPCHNSTFKLTGERFPGKPNEALRGMDQLESRVTTTRMVEVRYKRFVLGTGDKKELG